MHLGEEEPPGYAAPSGWTLRTMDADGSIKLLGVILRGVPNLPGAACQGHHELFEDVAHEDPVLRAQRVATAARLCRSCPERPACSASLAPSASLISAG